MELNKVIATLKAGETTLSNIHRGLLAIGERAGEIMAQRDACDADIMLAAEQFHAAAITRDQGKLAELSAKITGHLNQRQNLTARFEATLGSEVEQALGRIGEVASAALCVTPALAVVQKHLGELPAEVSRALFSGSSKLKFN